MYGVTLMGDYEDLDKLYDSISNYLSFYIDNAEYYPYHEYEYLLSLNYDIRHCYQGDRGYEIIDNNSDSYGSMAGVILEPTEEFREEIKNVRKSQKKGNLYYTVEILYPLIFHYMIAFEEILIDEPMDSWLEKFADLTEMKYPDADRNYPSSGAAGGLGFAFRSFLNADLVY